MKTTTARGFTLVLLLIVIFTGIIVASWYCSNLGTDDSWVEAAKKV